MLSAPVQERPDEMLVADAGALLAAFPATKAQLPRVNAAFRCARTTENSSPDIALHSTECSQPGAPSEPLMA